MSQGDALTDLADQALYQSRKNGRNRVTAWDMLAFAPALGDGAQAAGAKPSE